MQKINRTVIIILILTIAIAGQALPLAFHSSLEPIRIYADPGETFNREYVLHLSKDEKKTWFKAAVEDWWRSEDGLQSFYKVPGTPGNPARSCAAWVSINPVEASVEPDEKLVVKMTVSVPNDAKPGGYWCALSVSEQPDPLAPPGGVALKFYTSISLGVFVYIEPLERIAQITDVKILADQAVVTVRNDGNTPLAVSGKMEFLKKDDSKAVASADIPKGPLLPEPINSGQFRAKLPDKTALPSGEYLVRAIIDIGLDHYIGVQKEISINRDEADSSAQK